jgi:L-seryl-tRNA(Ser) seleniumtransferase
MARPRVNPPSIDTLLSHPVSATLVTQHGRERLKETFRTLTEEFRREAGPEDAIDRDTLVESFVERARQVLASRKAPGPSRVLNATGVLLHTNLGRAPLGNEAREAVLRAAGFCTLEYRLETGDRGKRGDHVQPLLNELFFEGDKAFDSLVVTNTAAALLLALDTLANGRKAAVSRGELVAIGGDFRVPSIMAKSGATLLEVGTTNKTTLADYREALEAGAGVVLKVHPSNYRIIGFTEEVDIQPLAGLCREFGVPLLYDAGTGIPDASPALIRAALRDVPSPERALREGADLVCFSADKTLGGPQTGVLLGRAELIGRAGKNPLARALRPDKLVLAALAATLDAHVSGKHENIPFFRMVSAPLAELRNRAEALVRRLSSTNLTATIVESQAAAGGGSGADTLLPSICIALTLHGSDETELAARLRRLSPPVIARIQAGRVQLDLRSLLPEEDEELAQTLRQLDFPQPAN